MAARVWLRSPAARIVAAAVAMLVVAELAALMLSPAQPGPDGLAVTASDYFGAEQLDRARDYRADTRLIGLGALLVPFATLAALALIAPSRLRSRFERLDRHPLLGAAAVGAAASLAVAIAELPLGLLSHELAVDVGLSVQSAVGWLFDWLRANAIEALYAAAGALLLILLQRRLPRGWWLAGAGVIVAFAVLVTMLAPVVLAPIFNDFKPLPEGPERRAVLELAEAAGVEVGDVYSVDASRRSTSLNAYIDGIGSTRRVVVYDNLLAATERGALRSVLAHELAHVSRRDIPRGLLFVFLVAPLGMLFVREAGAALAYRAGSGPGRLAAIPAYALALAVAAFALSVPGNQLSRAVEERADRFAVELTGDPGGLVELQTGLGRRNLSDPDPPGWSQFLFGTHPSKLERIGIAEAYEATEPAEGEGARPGVR